MTDYSIEFILTTPAVYPTPPGEYHYKLMKMEHAFALEAALQAKGDYFGHIQRCIHPDLYPEKNPNPYYAQAGNAYQGLVGFRFEVLGTKDIREAYKTAYEVLERTVGIENDYDIAEVGVSRGGVNNRPDRYHPKYNPS